MKIQLEPSSLIIPVNNASARVWTGTTDDGTEVQALIYRVALPASSDEANKIFARELIETAAPISDLTSAFPRRTIL